LSYSEKQKNELREYPPYHYKNIHLQDDDLLKDPKNMFIPYFIFIKPKTAYTVHTAVQVLISSHVLVATHHNQGLYTQVHLTLSNPIFLPPTYSPALIYFGLKRGWWITCPYYMRKSVGQAPTAERENKRNKKNVSDVFQHWSGTGKSCRTRSDVGSERVKT
jgi:hypothetical protein